MNYELIFNEIYIKFVKIVKQCKTWKQNVGKMWHNIERISCYEESFDTDIVDAVRYECAILWCL